VIRDADGKVLANGETTHVIWREQRPAEMLPKKYYSVFSTIVVPATRPEQRMSVALSGNDLSFPQLYGIALRSSQSRN